MKSVWEPHFDYYFISWSYFFHKNKTQLCVFSSYSASLFWFFMIDRSGENGFGITKWNIG